VIKELFLCSNSMVVMPIDVARNLISKEWNKYEKEGYSIGDLVTFIEALLIESFEVNLGRLVSCRYRIRKILII
jgi:hypothetical protein